MYIYQWEICCNVRKIYNEFLNALSSVVLYCNRNCLHNNKTPVLSLPLMIRVEVISVRKYLHLNPDWIKFRTTFYILLGSIWLLHLCMSTEGVTLPLADVCRTPFLHRLTANTAPTEQSCWRTRGSTNVPLSGVGEFSIMRNVKSLFGIFFCFVSGADVNYRN
jgi:hypothetical protein